MHGPNNSSTDEVLLHATEIHVAVNHNKTPSTKIEENLNRHYDPQRQERRLNKYFGHGRVTNVDANTLLFRAVQLVNYSPHESKSCRWQLKYCLYFLTLRMGKN